MSFLHIKVRLRLTHQEIYYLFREWYRSTEVYLLYKPLSISYSGSQSNQIIHRLLYLVTVPANPPGKSTPFVTLGQTVRATFTYVDPNTGKQQDISKTFVVTGIMAPTGNNQLDRAVIINAVSGDSLFLKSGKYDQMVVVSYLRRLCPHSTK